jgi:hypothetical protein
MSHKDRAPARTDLAHNLVFRIKFNELRATFVTAKQKTGVL